jgi:hypothetical protein
MEAPSKPAPVPSTEPATLPPDAGAAPTWSEQGIPLPSAAMIPPELANHPRYSILEPIGRGGMGEVYKARDVRMGRIVALKVMNASLISDAAAVQRFEHEVKAAAHLAHPNIVTAFDADQAGPLRFLVMEYIDGQSVADLLQARGRLPVAQACDMVRQAALGLQHAFERGMVHRDIKPHNLMRTADGTVKILDFGLARLVRAGHQGVTQLTQQGVMMGTVDYMAPEQASDSRGADIRSDIYSLGCTLYQALTGRVPFPNGGPIDKVVKHAVERPTPIQELRPDVPTALVRAVSRMMAKEPGARFQTPAEVASLLALFTESEVEPVFGTGVPVVESVSDAATAVIAPTTPPLPPALQLTPEERTRALRRLRGPAAILTLAAMAYGFMTVVCSGFLIYGLVMWLSSSGSHPPDEYYKYSRGGWTDHPSFGSVVGLGFLAVFLMSLTVVIAYGASQLRRGQNYYFALAAVIAALLPITPMILFTAPTALIILARLSEPKVKALFGLD